MSHDTGKPIRVLKDYPLEAAIWRRSGDNGPWYSVKLSRTYKDGGSYKRTDTVSGAQLLQMSHLAAKAYDAVAKLEAQDRANAEECRDER